jgi:hypothetical protein
VAAKPYFIKTKTKVKTQKKTPPRFPPANPKPVESTPSEAPIGVVQGRIPKSKEEWRVANALWRLGIPFSYQVDFQGGAMVRGGQVIDFLVRTVPLPTPLYVQGTYWHPEKTRLEQVYKLQTVRRVTRGTYAMPKEVWDYDLKTMDQAYETLKGIFR